MAAVLNLEPEAASSRDEADAAIDVVLAYVGSLPARTAVPLIGRMRGRLDAVEARKLSSAVIGAGGPSRLRRSRVRATRPRRDLVKRAARRAAVVKKNPKIADKMDYEELTSPANTSTCWLRRRRRPTVHRSPTKS